MLGTVDRVRARKVIVSLWQRPRGQGPPGSERSAGPEPRGEPRTAALAKLCRSAKPVRWALVLPDRTRGHRYRRRRPWLPLHHLPHTAAGGIKGDHSGAARRTDRAACNSPARSSYGLTPLVAANPEQPGTSSTAGCGVSPDGDNMRYGSVANVSWPHSNDAESAMHTAVPGRREEFETADKRR